MGGKFAANSQTQRLPQPSQPHRVNSTVTLLNESFLGRLQVGHILVFFRQGFHRRETRHHHCVESKIKNKKTTVCTDVYGPKVSTNICQGQRYSLLCSINTHMHKLRDQIIQQPFSVESFGVFPKDLPPCLSIYSCPPLKPTSKFSTHQDAATLWVNRSALSSCHLPLFFFTAWTRGPETFE